MQVVLVKYFAAPALATAAPALATAVHAPAALCGDNGPGPPGRVFIKCAPMDFNPS